MASDPYRPRIDQYFSSKKKRKILPPESKSVKGESERRIQFQGSPSGKGSLGRFVQCSNRDFSAEASNTSCEEKYGKVAPKRKLPLHSEPLPNNEPIASRIAETIPGNGSSEIGSVARNPEINEFATGFLSLYCSEIQSSLNLPSQEKQVALLLDESSTKKELCATSPIAAQDVMQKNQLVSVADLRKCNYASSPSIVECQKTSSSDVTPHSSKGSSSISPGEAFWNEVMNVADGLANEGLSSHVGTGGRALNVDNANRDSEKLEEVVCHGNMSKMAVDGVLVMDYDGNSDGVLVMNCDGNSDSGKHSAGIQEKNPKNDTSPLPVKHFDFGSEAENFDKGKNANITKILVPEKKEILRASSCHHCLQNNGRVTTSRSMSNEQVEGCLHLNSGNATCSTPAYQYNTVAVGAECKRNSPPANSSTNCCFRLDNWLPPEICSVYNKRGISQLYSWQVDCLQVDGVLDNRNLIYCASTSAGKSFVAEILMLRRILATGKVALLVLPYVSICAEKAEHLEALLEPVDKHVRSFYGNQGGGNLPKDTSVVVCTIEKANSLINRLLEEGRLSELGTIVIDELHMVGDQSRGYLLELMLTKLLYATGEGNADSFSSGESSGTSSEKSDPAYGLQIVGMSATLPNVAAIADWLHAALYVTTFRPVPLEEYIKVGCTIYNKEMQIVRTIPKVATLGGKDPDQIVELCNEVVQEGHSVLIFCSSRKGCESTAQHISKYFKRFSVGSCEQDKSFDIDFALESLRRSPAGLDPVLEETLPVGVAYHHAGLTVEERETVETCYRKGLVRVLTATSTLAAGVNLPARRVIFRQPRIGCDFIDGIRYKQMAGRAGRTGIDTKGESVLICKPEETKRVSTLLNDNCQPLCSCLSEDRNGMTHAILEVVAGGIVQTANDIHRYVRCTLLNSTRPFEDVVKSAQDSLRWLCRKKFLEWNDETKLYTTTPLGRASFGSSLCPEESLVVLDDLMRAREGFVLASDLHLVYLVTPINVDVEPDWELYYERFMQLSSLDQSVGNRVGVQESFLMKMAHGAPSNAFNRSRNIAKDSKRKSANILTSTHDTFSNEKMIRVCKRLYVALILSRLVQEVPVGEVCQGFKVARGMVQALQENAGRFASMLSVFCERLGWHDLESLVSKFQNRVSFGVRAEIAELTTIPYVKGSRARALYMAGLRTPQAVAEASIPEIIKAIFESSSWGPHAARQMQLGLSKKIKNGAQKIVLEKAEEARVAAFSAFKSLGFDVPQFSRPLFSLKADNDVQKELTSSSEGDLKSGNARSSKFKPGYITVLPSADAKNIAGSSFEVNGEKSFISNSQVVLLEEPASAVNIDANFTGEISLKNLERGPVSAASIPGGLDTFLDLWSASSDFFFDVHYTKKSELHSTTPFELHGIAICWENSPVYYLNIPKDLLRCSTAEKERITKQDIKPPELQMGMANERWDRIKSIMARPDVRKFSWNLKTQFQVLMHPHVGSRKFGSLHGGFRKLGAEITDNSEFMLSPIRVRLAIDMAIVAWILSPDEKKISYPNLEKEVKKRLSSDAAVSAKRSGRWKDQMRAAAHNGCCCRVAQNRALFSVLWKLLESQYLMEPLLAIEVRLSNVLADMEIWGIGVDMDGCFNARRTLGRKLKCLEKEAYELAGKKFSLSVPAEVSSVLYEHLKLPIPEGRKGKQHPSTDKICLDFLRNEHPLVAIIKEHRTLSKLLRSTLGSICSLARLCVRSQRYTVHGHWLQTSTGTGRLSMKEPNLQCVEHPVEFEMNDDNGKPSLCIINARDLFVPSQEDWVLLSADYANIEFRLAAHFSNDCTLIELLSSPSNDIFVIIAAKWKNKHESTVMPQERDETKKLVYGVMYGMGPKRLAKQLDCSQDEAAEKIHGFKASFSGVASWVQDAVATCQLNGYVETLKGRKRYLTNIKLGNGEEKSKARRQVVNSICQGSAADIIKIAMIYLHDVIDEFSEAPCPGFMQNRNFQMLKSRCRIMLQVHDELLLEVDPSVVNEAGLLLRVCMENAVSLSVPLPVKLKKGKTWGTMEPFEPKD